MKVLKWHFKEADRVFLGTDEPRTLRLLSNSRLSGTGQVRLGYNWQTFAFSCAMDPWAGKAVSFETTVTP
jgi:plasmid rolling circle replication initiator protein Rep